MGEHVMRSLPEGPELTGRNPAVKEAFGVTRDGEAVEKYTLRNGKISCCVITYGAAIQALEVPDRQGKMVDVALGFDSMEAYQSQDKFMGASIGRCANRIGGASFPLNGTVYPLAANNNGVNHLHGGLRGFDKRVWQAAWAVEDAMELRLESPDGEEGYPGRLAVSVTFALEDAGLSVIYRAVCDRDTVCNLTNHAYFNLAGHDSGPVLDQTIQLQAGGFTPTAALSIPTGEVAPVDGTPMDLRTPAPIGAHIGEDFPQLVQAGGYDHNWALDGAAGTLRPAARACSPATGIALEVLTTQPGIQFYTGNHMQNCPTGKGGAPYDVRWGFCLETQHFPDAPHHDAFPSVVLRPGDLYEERTLFRFSVE